VAVGGESAHISGVNYQGHTNGHWEVFGRFRTVVRMKYLTDPAILFLGIAREPAPAVFAGCPSFQGSFPVTVLGQNRLDVDGMTVACFDISS
jgi:hypothetical protein